MSQNRAPSQKLIIEGTNQAGQKFRPSDWAERMSGTLSTVKNHRIQYSPLLQPIVINGTPSIQLDTALADLNPALYQAIMDFAETNCLKVHHHPPANE